MKKIPTDILMEKELQKYTANALEENHARTFSHKLVLRHQKKTFHKKVSGGLLLNVFQKRVQTRKIK